MSRSLLGAAIAVAVLAGGPLRAADPVAPVPAAPATDSQPLDPKAAAAAKELLRLMDYEQVVAQGMKRSIDMMRSGAVLSQSVDANPAMRMARAKNPQQWDIVLKRAGGKQADVLEKTMNELLPELRALSIRIYATNFTVAELDELRAFYGTPVGKKVLTRMPALMQQVMAWTQAEMPRRIAPAMQAIAQQTQREIAPLMAK